MIDLSGGSDSTFVSSPLVSVVICNFNQPAFIEAAIRSVAAQSYENFECVVVDDKSSDNSAERIQTSLVALGDERFRFIQRDVNGGQMVAMLTGMDAVSAPFITFVDGDDIWHGDFLKHHLAAHFGGAGFAAVSTSDLALIDESNQLVAGGHPVFREGNPRHIKARAKISSICGEGEDTLVFVDRGPSNWIWSTTSGMMFRRNVLDIMRPGNPEDIRICADAYLALSAHILGGTVRLERVLGCYRIHPTNSWATGQFFGQGSHLGEMTRETRMVVREALLDRLLTVAPEIEKAVSRRYLRRTVVAYVGWLQALNLCRSNPSARRLLLDWLPRWIRPS
jgi:glycosyltransferase involved in cell wall biosynthesis